MTLKAYDPASGVCLKFKTDRAADVGRLINGLGQLGRHMAALPQKTEDSVMEDVAIVADGTIQSADKGDPKPGGAAAKKKKKGKK